MPRRTEIKDYLPGDAPRIVTLDAHKFGAMGVNARLLFKKYNSPNADILIMENNREITGFTIIEYEERGQLPEDFSRPVLTRPIPGKWMFFDAFTTASDYEDLETDSKLLGAAELKARMHGCSSFCVPLSKDHPYPKAYAFFEANGYEKFGTITWNPNPGEPVECFLYGKYA